MIKHLLLRLKGSVEIRFNFHVLKKRKLTIGSSKITLGKEWILSEYDALDASKASDWQRLFGDERLTNILAEHVWEHIPDEETRLSNQNCYDWLQKGGRLRIAVPDGNNPDKEYIEWVRVGGTGVGADDHKILYTYDVMKNRLEKAGFRVELLEYWDENGKFNYTDWSLDGGMIHRSRRYDPRNKDGKLGYTSLIVDAVKD
jgi:predicted SAM-dependent methyltransferase